MECDDSSYYMVQAYGLIMLPLKTTSPSMVNFSGIGGLDSLMICDYQLVNVCDWICTTHLY